MIVIDSVSNSGRLTHDNRAYFIIFLHAMHYYSVLSVKYKEFSAEFKELSLVISTKFKVLLSINVLPIKCLTLYSTSV